MKSVMCVGQLVADVVVRPVECLPDVGTASLVEDIRLLAGGCACNTASVLAKMGVKTSIAGVIGNDRMGDVVRASLEECGVDSRELVVRSDVPTSAAAVMVDKMAERAFFYCKGGNEELTCEMISDDALKSADFVHVGGAMKLDRLDIGRLFSRAKQAGCATSLDTDWDPSGQWMSVLAPALAEVDYLLTNESEGKMLTGCESPADVGRMLLTCGPKVVVIKRGGNGAVVVTAGGVDAFPTYNVSVVDTTCAGDSFVGGFIYGLVKGWPLAECARFANAAGAISTTDLSHAALKSARQVSGFLHESSVVGT